MSTAREPGAESVPNGQSTEVLALIEDYLDQLADATHARLGDVAGVAVTMATEAGTPITIGASSALARAVDELQYDIGRGPCLHALRGGGGEYVPSLAADRRWDPYGPEAAALGAACCLSVPVVARDAVLAVLKVYDGEIDGLDVEQRRIGHEAAAEVAGGIALARSLASTSVELADRATAMDSRRVIDLALGILIERTRCSPDQAFALLRQYSQTRNVKLREVATGLVNDAYDHTDQQGRDGARSEQHRAPFTGRSEASR